MRPFLFLFFLLLFVPSIHADSVHGDGPGAALVGGFDANLDGIFVDVAQSDGTLTITDSLGVIAIRAPTQAPVVDGPLADFGTVQIHDNIHSWIHIQGSFSIDANQVDRHGRGLMVDGRYLVGLDLEWERIGSTLSIDASDALLSTDDSFQALGPEPSAWALLDVGAQGPVMDWFAFGEAPFRTVLIDDAVHMEWVGTIGDSAPDTLIRIEEHGFFADRDDRFVLRMGDLVARNVDADAMAPSRGSFSFHGLEAEHTRLDVRLPPGLSGAITWSQDLDTPRLEDRVARNLTPYAPLLKVPELITTWDEPVWVELAIGEQQKVATKAAQEVRFRLTGLQPDTSYPYTLTARDLAGNPAVVAGTITTGPRDGPSAVIDIQSWERTATGIHVRFNATSDTGEPVDASAIHVFVDKRAATGIVSQDLGGFHMDVASDAREIRIEVQTPVGRISEVIHVTDDRSTPVPLWLALAAVWLVRRR